MISSARLRRAHPHESEMERRTAEARRAVAAYAPATSTSDGGVAFEKLLSKRRRALGGKLSHMF